MTVKQSRIEVPLIMLFKCITFLWLCVHLLIFIAMSRVGMSRNFVTRRDAINWTVVDGVRVERQLHSGSDIPCEEYYQLRFQPAKHLQRLFWHKWQQQQAEPATTTTTIMPEITEPAITEPITTSSTTTPAPTTSTTKKPKRPTTTRTSIIMRPSKVPHFHAPLPSYFGNTLKQLLLFGSPIEANLLQQQHKNAPKTGKGKGFLSLFEVIKFPNSKCSVAMGDIRSMEGVCYHDFECKSLGGISTERCAEGVGVCCIFLTGCGDVTNQPIVYFESPNYPNAVREMMICVLIVTVRKNVQQLRLDFLMFELNRPTDGDCVDDQFVISGHNINFQVPMLCGINTGQHMYIHVGNAFENKVYISVFVKVPTGGRSFNIKILQLEDGLAPENCLQYFTEPEGIIKSFNYDIDGTVVDNRVATYINNLNYAICIKRAKDTCSTTYTTEQLNGDGLDFQIINKDEAENDVIPDGQAGAGIFNCPDDYIAINSVRLCGERFNDGTDNEDYTMHAPIKDLAAGPIVLPFHTDAEYVGRGFRLLYKQELCV